MLLMKKWAVLLNSAWIMEGRSNGDKLGSM